MTVEFTYNQEGVIKVTDVNKVKVDPEHKKVTLFVGENYTLTSERIEDPFRMNVSHTPGVKIFYYATDIVIH